MPSIAHIATAASLLTLAQALSGIVVPSTITAAQPFNATFQNANSDSYRVFLAASVTGTQGPMCYLQNSTNLDSPLSLNISEDVGPDADYYSIGIADLTASSGPTYSNKFNFSGGSGEPTEYEKHLNGAPFWDANKLPCSAMACARSCAQASYPGNLQEGASYETLKNCILACPGVEPDANLRAADGSPSSIAGAIVTLSGGAVVTALETVVTSGGSSITEAIVGSTTVTVGETATVSGGNVGLATSGVIVGGTTTVAFSNVAGVTSSASVTSGTESAASGAGASSTSKGGAAAMITAVPAFAAAAGLIAMAM
nr:hypothetical protein B0A51_11152 [Rachicladosporium sp. CCFEE 5018]OQO23624.1 hypothetical protein B0A51_10010 [Rachicladosporium sp. CCFEE 5018]